MNPVLHAIRSRRSIRRFTADPVDPDRVRVLLEAAAWAPSGLNNQPWRFVVATDPDLRASLARCTKYGRILEAAPLLVAVLLDSEASYDRTKDVQAVGACIQNMLLAAQSLGLGAVWIGEILNRRAEVESLLGLGPTLELMAVVAVGRPAEAPTPRRRRSLEELVVAARGIDLFR